MKKQTSDERVEKAAKEIAKILEKYNVELKISTQLIAKWSFLY